MQALKRLLRELYHGTSRRARWARFGLLIFDVITVTFFLITTFVDYHRWIIVVDVVIGVLLLLEFLARFTIAHNRPHFMVRPVNLADMVVILSLLAPAVAESFAFLRVLRALRLLRSYHMVHELREHFRFFARNQDVVFSVLNLAVFIFVVTALVYVLQVRVNPGIEDYVDALYFTITTLTTTGFGDITLVGSTGRMLSVVIMIVGISLFLRLIQSIFRSGKVRQECPQCGLSRHDADAVHCKHCGTVIHIATEGA